MVMVQRPVNRMPPKLPAAAMKTYTIARPVPTHYRYASCEEVNCPSYLNGWRTVVDEDKARLARRSGRRYTESRDPSGLVTLEFEPGQRCFRCPPPELLGRDTSVMPELAGRMHIKPLEREPLYLVRGGDHRGNPLGLSTRRHRRAEDWVEDFAAHQDALATRLARG